MWSGLLFCSAKRARTSCQNKIASHFLTLHVTMFTFFYHFLQQSMNIQHGTVFETSLSEYRLLKMNRTLRYVGSIHLSKQDSYKATNSYNHAEVVSKRLQSHAGVYHLLKDTDGLLVKGFMELSSFHTFSVKFKEVFVVNPA